MSKYVRVLLLYAAALVVYGTTYANGQGIAPASGGHKTCGPIEAAMFSRKDAPVIYGEPYVVPTIELRVVDENTKKPQAGRQVVFHYQWLWWEYSYPDRIMGAWSNASVLTRCTTDESGVVTLPRYEVRPSGWYKGEMALGHDPKFDKLSVQVLLDKHIIAGEYSKAEIDRLKKEEKTVIVFTVN